jgi:hypothetical protein
VKKNRSNVSPAIWNERGDEDDVEAVDLVPELADAGLVQQRGDLVAGPRQLSGYFCPRLCRRSSQKE